MQMGTMSILHELALRLQCTLRLGGGSCLEGFCSRKLEAEYEQDKENDQIGEHLQRKATHITCGTETQTEFCDTGKVRL